MTDQELDHLLTSSMRVDHSVDFLPRVRRRVEAEPSPSPWSGQWRLVTLAAALAASAVAAILVWPTRNDRLPVRHPSPDVAATAHVVTAPPAPIRRHPAPRPPVAGSARTGRARPAARSLEPEVLIPPDEIRGFEMLVAAAREGRLPQALPSDGLRKHSALSLQPIEIPPVSIESLSPTAPFEGERP